MDRRGPDSSAARTSFICKAWFGQEEALKIIYPATHPIITELRRRINGETPQFKLALSIEGGGMRSVISAGMMYALEERGIGPQYFDAVFGASGGSFNAAYYIAGQSEEAMKGYWENTGKDLIDFSRAI